MKNHMKKYVALSLAAAIVAGSAGVYTVTTDTNAQTTDSASSTTANASTVSAQAATSAATNTNANNQTPPAKPDASSSGQTPSDKPDGDTGNAPGGAPGQSSQTSVSYSAAKKISKNTTINKGSNEAKSITLKLDKTSKITLTGDSYVTSLEDADSSYSNINFNGYTLYVNGVALN